VGERKIMNHFVVRPYSLVNSPMWSTRKFAQAAKTFKHSNTEFAEFGVFLNQKLFTPRPPRLRGAISESLRCGRRSSFSVFANRSAALAAY